MRPKPHDVRHVCVPLPSAKGGGIRVLQGVRSRRTRPAVASRVTLQSGRGPTDPAARSPRAQWLRRCQRPGAVGSQPTAACCGRESNPRHPGYEPGALPLSYHDLVPPRFRIPARNTPRRPSGDGASAPRARRDQPLLKDAGAARHVRAD